MKIFIGSDHAGFHLKSDLLAHLSKRGLDVEDVGNKVLDPDDDYPQFAFQAAMKVLGSEDPDARAILVCGSGQGMCIAANRMRGIRAAIIWDKHGAQETREDNDSNVLCLPARTLEEGGQQAIYDIVDTWIDTPFSGAPRHIRRLKEIEEIYS